MNVPDLAGLGDPAAVLETLPAVIGDGVRGVLGEATEHQETRYRGAGAPLARVAIHDHDVIHALRQEGEHLLTDLEEDVHGWGVVILPLVLAHHVLEFLVVVLATRQVEDQVRVFVLLLKKCCYLSAYV